MRTRSTILIGLVLTLVGCRNPMRYELVERDLRWQEDEIYFLEDELEDAYAQLDSCRRENQTLRDENERLGSGGASSLPSTPRGRGSRGAAEPRLPAAESPSVDLGQPSEAMPPLFREQNRPEAPAALEAAPSYDGPPLIDPLPGDEGTGEVIPAPQGAQDPPDFAPRFGRRALGPGTRRGPASRATPAAYNRRRDAREPVRRTSANHDGANQNGDITDFDRPERQTGSVTVFHEHAPLSAEKSVRSPFILDEGHQFVGDVNAVIVAAEETPREKTAESPISGEKLLKALGVDQPPAEIVAGAEVTAVAFNRLISGGHNTDGRLGDEGLLVVVEPRDAAGQVVNTKAKVSLVVLDPAEQGAAARVARWDFAPGEAAGRFQQGVFGKGMKFDLPWPNQPPRHANLKLFARLTTDDGRVLQAERALVVNPCPAPSGGWTAAARVE